MDKGIENAVSDSHSFAIYGSFASGEFDEKSDLDLIIIGKKSDFDFDFLTKFRKSIKREVQIYCLFLG